MAGVAALIVAVAIDGQFVGIELEARVVGLDREPGVIEDEELGFRSDIDQVADLGLLQVRLGALGDHARIARIALAGQRLENIAKHRRGRLRIERIDMGRIGIRHQRHVALVDGFPAGDRGGVEHDAVGESVFIHEQRRPS